MQAVLRSGLSGTAGAETAPDLSVTQMTWRLIRAIPFSPLAFVLCLAVVAGVMGFTKSKVLRIRAAGILHGVLHLVLTFAVIAAASLLLHRLELADGRFVAAFVGLVGVVGGLLGSWLLAGYLLVADRKLHCNSNELFAAQRNRHYKNFLRIHFDSAGGVTVYPVKVARTARNWRLRQRGEPHASWLVPDEPDAPLEAELIEEPFTIVPVGAPGDGDREYAEAGSRTH